MRTMSQRGSALLLAIVVVLVGAVIGVAMMRFGVREVAGATAIQRQQALSACADLGRQVITSRFRAVGLAPVALDPLSEPVDGGKNLTLLGGHYGTTTSGMTLEQVNYLPDAAFGADNSAIQGITNRVFLSGGGARPMKVVVRCKMGGSDDPDSGRQLEVEFGLRFGI